MAALVKTVADQGELSPEAMALLRAGAAHIHSKPISYTSEVHTKRRALCELERRGFVRFLNVNSPMVTDAGRAFIGAPSEMEQSRQELLEISRNHARRREELKKAGNYDGRSVGEYKHLKELQIFCVPVFRHREGATTAFSRDGGLRPWAFVKTEKLWVQSESVGHFLLILIASNHAKWIRENQGVDLFATPPDLSDLATWTDGDRATWSSLRAKSENINRRIRNPRLVTGGYTRPVFGATA